MKTMALMRELGAPILASQRTIALVRRDQGIDGFARLTQQNDLLRQWQVNDGGLRNECEVS